MMRFRRPKGYIPPKELQHIKKGEIVIRKYRWPGESKRDYYYRVTQEDDGRGGVYAKVVGVRRDGKTQSISNSDTSRLWDYEFRIGKKTPTQGWGRAYKSNSGQGGWFRNSKAHAIAAKKGHRRKRGRRKR